ncbi:uncharacterized protein J4E79_007575 [Alternaria viburni]|uniref:uncharacterized protein n=1 Tax=Alternaria viburni TaxID=566460 RepID=UPI0020C2C62A|nr:uncharacterized protein J4E79_007575 [Alternaria viburni]KAI4657500.1 hypothetical protein J4E79_007575 [Alternaria viburni]
MSKAVNEWKQLAKALKDGPEKLIKAALADPPAPGTRIFPPNTPKKNEEWGFRVDSGHYNEQSKELNAVLQINNEATAEALVAYRAKHKAHAKLATEKFNTAAEDLWAEFDGGSGEGQAWLECSMKCISGAAPLGFFSSLSV